MPEPIHQQNKAANGDNNVAKMHDENQRGIVSRRNGRCKPAYNAGEWTYEARIECGENEEAIICNPIRCGRSAPCGWF